MQWLEHRKNIGGTGRKVTSLDGEPNSRQVRVRRMVVYTEHGISGLEMSLSFAMEMVTITLHFNNASIIHTHNSSYEDK